MTRFPTFPSDILSRADELLSAKYGTDRPIDPEIVELVCRGMMEERERCANVAEDCEIVIPSWGQSDQGRIDHSRIAIAKAIRGTE